MAQRPKDDPATYPVLGRMLSWVDRPGSDKKIVWVLGMVLYVALMAEAFMGYVLPWGNMSYWGAEVIVSLVGAVPFDWVPFIDADLAKSISGELTTWIRGDYLLSTATVNKFMALHVVAIPIILLALVVLHLLALHEVGSNNPDGVEIKKLKDENGIPLDGIAFHPYYTVKDSVGIVIFLMVFCVVIFFFPDGGGYFLEKPNFEPANALKTPAHIAPAWYYGPFYAMLRAVPSKGAGVIVMGGAIAILFVLPWIDRNPVKSIRYKGLLSKVLLAIFSINFVMLGYLGTQPGSDLATLLSRVGTLYYFAYFPLLMFIHKLEKSKTVPERVTGGH